MFEQILKPTNQVAAGTQAAASNEGIGHTPKGTSWGQGAAVYATVRHGPDGAQFLDPYFLPALLDGIAGMSVADIGCGAGPWAVVAGQYGAGRVEALDIQESFVRLASDAVSKAGLSECIRVSVGDAAALNFPDNSFDRAMSINVGCNLPTASFKAHFREMFRTLKPGATAIVTAPANLDLVFTNGTVPAEQTLRDIESALAAIGFTDDSPSVIAHLNVLTNVYRATFYADGGGVKLFRSGDNLEPGTPIWRKLPAQAVPNRYHHEDEYEAASRDTGFSIELAIRASFESELARTAYAGQNAAKPLGPEYVGNNPFLVLVLRKPHSAI